MADMAELLLLPFVGSCSCCCCCEVRSGPTCFSRNRSRQLSRGCKAKQFVVPWITVSLVYKSKVILNPIKNFNFSLTLNLINDGSSTKQKKRNQNYF